MLVLTPWVHLLAPLGTGLCLLLAYALDRFFGEPPTRVHPVAAMGRMISLVAHLGRSAQPWFAFLVGIGVVVLGMVVWGGLGIGVHLLGREVPWLGLILEVALLKTTFSVSGLVRAAVEVHRALVAGDLVEARRLLAWHLVSRDTSTLDQARVSAAVIESVAENASDSMVAPWFWYLVGGLPAALVYRYVNTADAMLGYRDAEREWLGKAAARLDDLLNLIPARVTALSLLLAALCVGGNARKGFHVWWSDAGQTASPNAGQPMAVVAGILEVELEKPGHYVLHRGADLPSALDIPRVLRLLSISALLLLLLGVLCTGVLLMTGL